MKRIEIPAAQVPVPGARSRVRLEGRDIALFNIEGTLYAIDDSCPHQGASLASGLLNGRQVQCRAHGLRFDLATGRMPGASGFGVRAHAIEHSAGGGALLVLTEPANEEDPR